MTWLLVLVSFVAGAGSGYRWCLSRQRSALRRRSSSTMTLLQAYHPNRQTHPHSSGTGSASHHEKTP